MAKSRLDPQFEFFNTPLRLKRPHRNRFANPFPDWGLPKNFRLAMTPLRLRLTKLDLPQTSQGLAMHLSVVVPIYNEEENLPHLYQGLLNALDPLPHSYELIMVNDGSRDESAAVLDQLAQADDRVKVVEFRRNFGQTAAMQAGIQAASGDVVITIDADLQNDPADIAMMLDQIERGYDLVHGWRKKRQDTFINRKLPSKIANWLIAKVTGFPVNDLGCTLKVIRTEIAQELQLYGEMHRFIPILAHWRGARCVEVVTNHRPRLFGQSKYGISRVTRVLLDLMTVKYLIQYVVSPMKLFGSIGLMCAAAAMVSGTATLWMKLGQGVDMTGNPLLLLSAFCGMVAVQFLCLGMLGELCSRIYFQVQKTTPYGVRRTLNLENGREAATVQMKPKREAA